MEGVKRRKPCKDCPFREDVPGYLTAQRVREIAGAIRHDGYFPCHKTLDYDNWKDEGEYTHDTRFCTGALIHLEKSGVGAYANVCARIETMLGNLDLNTLDYSAPVFGSVDAMAHHHQRPRERRETT